MKKLNFKIWSIVLRYLIMIAIALPGLWIFYAVFTPLTVYPVYSVIKLFLPTTLAGTTLLINGRIPIELVAACIAGSAYYLLFIFNITIPGIKLEKRVGMILLSFFVFLMLNIIRIISLIFLYVSGSSLFYPIHEIFWYVLSTVFVVGIWFAEVKLYRIREIPVYSDIKFLFGKIKK